jgi:molybdenum cofactor cytidylyltransferase
MACGDIAVVVLAAGEAKRFGSNKLAAPLDGIPLGLHIGKTLATMGFGWRFAVCQAGAKLAKHFSAMNFAIIDNAAPENGQAHSLHLAVHAAERTTAKGLLVTLADMPFVTQSHLAAVAAGDGLTASSSGNAPMPPALFPRSYWPMLLATDGDAGARQLLGDANIVTATPDELRDIDVVADLPRPQSQ